MLLAVASVLFSHEPARSAQSLPGLSLYLLLPIAMDTVRSRDQARGLLLTLAAVGVLESLYSFWQYGRGRGVLADRIRGGLSHYMTFSAIAMIAGCLLLAWLLEERGRRRWIGILCLVPFAAIALTLTRGAYVGTLAALAVYLAVRRPRGLLAAIPLAAVLIAASPQDVRQRFVSIVDLQDETNRDRIAMARAGLRMIADRPIFGHGPEMIKSYYVLYRDEDAPRWRVPHLHNNVLQIGAAMGIFAAAAYLAIVALVLARTIARLRATSRGESGFSVPPHRRASPGVERIDNLLRADAMENDDPILDDDRCGKALTDGLAPHDPRPLRRPRFGKGGSGVDAVPVGAEKLRPIGGGRAPPIVRTSRAMRTLRTIGVRDYRGTGLGASVRLAGRRAHQCVVIHRIRCRLTSMRKLMLVVLRAWPRRPCSRRPRVPDG